MRTITVRRSRCSSQHNPAIHQLSLDDRELGFFPATAAYTPSGEVPGFWSPHRVYFSALLRKGREIGCLSRLGSTPESIHQPSVDDQKFPPTVQTAA